MSKQVELAVELSSSFAHRVKDDIHVVLQLADERAVANASLQLQAGKKVVRVPATPAATGGRGDRGGPVLEVYVPAADLRPGVWRLGLVGSDDGVTALRARLLNSRRQPIALLPGPVPRTLMAPPQRRPAAAAAPDGRARAYATASRLANRGLALLPEQRATRYRAVLKKAGRRLLG
ncbi:MAG TPA: hypothetical protein VER39_12860 [Nocardioidaceae bacterium]|nr:hypothetical protein [Nocardioidaceae bacterium]